MYSIDELRRNILERLIHLDIELAEKYKNNKKVFKLIIVGSSAIALKHNLLRITDDIDSLHIEEELWEFLRKNYEVYRINDRCKGIILLHPDYEERLVKIKIDYKFNFLDIYLLSDYDLIITKFGRGYPQDLKDIKESGILKNIDIHKLHKLANESFEYHVGEEKLKKNWALFTNEILEER
ncbi:MAG TPA: DUF6036 family nucleotidyltransferase [Acetivibrio sp.]|nr:DUF6036 family nucleotidyltransferase [Acetivibrio sp.]